MLAPDQLASSALLSLAGPFDQPLQHGIKVGLFLGADSVAADFAMRNRFEIQCLDQLINRQFLGQVRLIAKDEQRDAIKDWLFEQGMKLLSSYRERLMVRGIYDISLESGQLDTAANNLAPMSHTPSH